LTNAALFLKDFYFILIWLVQVRRFIRLVKGYFCTFEH
jgi:hypothetical protein